MIYTNIRSGIGVSGENQTFLMERISDFFLDTHALLWLHEEELSKFKTNTLKLMEENELYYSPIVKIELHYLHQKRISKKLEDLLSSLKKVLD